MTLPSPGNPIDTVMIHEEYYKTTHTTQAVDISTMSILYNIADASVQFSNFYDLVVIDASINHWWDLDGTKQIGSATGDTTAVELGEFIINPSFGSFDTGTLDLVLRWSALSVDYTKNSNDCSIGFYYDKGTGWVKIKDVDMNVTDNFTWIAGNSTIIALTPAESLALKFRFSYSFEPNVVNINDLVQLNNPFSFVLFSIKTVPAYIPIDTSTWEITELLKADVNMAWTASIP